MASTQVIDKTWAERVAHNIGTSPTKWAMLTSKQRQYIYRGFVVGFTQGEQRGYTQGEADTEEAVRLLHLNYPQTLYNWVEKHPKTKDS